VADDASRRAIVDLASGADYALVSEEMPLRANLSVIENIAIVPQYRSNMAYNQAADLAWSLLAKLGRTDCAFKRDPDLSREERFIAKLLRACIGSPSIIVIDRPALLLPDIHYPPFVDACLSALDDTLKECWIVDYAWNEPLYAPR
jgi:ABC-type lipoprotein export system ATPase subunit